MREQVKLINENKGFFRQKFRDEQDAKTKYSYVVEDHFNTFCNKRPSHYKRNSTFFRKSSRGSKIDLSPLQFISNTQSFKLTK